MHFRVTQLPLGTGGVLSRDNGSSVNLPRKCLGSLYSLGKNLRVTGKRDQSSATRILLFLIKKNKVTDWKQTQAENNSASGAKSQTQAWAAAVAKHGAKQALGKDELGEIQISSCAAGQNHSDSHRNKSSHYFVSPYLLKLISCNLTNMF